MINTSYLNDFNSPIRQINGKVELLESSTTTNSGEIIRADYVAPYTNINIKAESKNLIPYPFTSSTTTKNGVTFTDNGDGTITANGTATENVVFYFRWDTGNPLTFPKGRYTLSGSPDDGVYETYYVGFAYTNGTTDRDAGAYEKGTTVELEKVRAIYIVVKKGITANNVIFKPQLEKGTKATPYTPYINFTEMKPGGKNLIPFPYSESTKTRNGITFTVNDDGSIDINGTATEQTNFALCKKDFGNTAMNSIAADSDTNGTYTISKRMYYDAVNKLLSITILNGRTVNERIYPQVELGKVATPYEPYIPIPANEITVYGRNLIPYPYYYNTNKTINGVDFTINEDRSITVKGTATENAYFYLQVGYDYGVGMNSASTGANSATNGTYTISKRMMYWNKELAIVVYKGDTADETLYPQLEVGTIATEYEPYKPAIIYPLSATTLEITPSCHTTTLIASSGVYMSSTFKNVNPKLEYTHADILKSVKVERQCESGKFFGFGVSQKIVIDLLDPNRELDIVKDNAFKLHFNINNNDYVNNFPIFYVDEPKRDENTNDITITAYDVLYAAAADTIADAGLQGTTILDYAQGIASIMSLELDIRGLTDNSIFTTQYPNGANFEGSETLRGVLDDIAEATQTIYYVSENKLVFKRLKFENEPDLTIEKQHYFTLESKSDISLKGICITNELGDAISYEPNNYGSLQYIRDNGFYSTLEGDEVAAALNEIDIYSIFAIPFNLSWRGNFLLEIGDKLAIEDKSGNMLLSYFLNDTITYNGGYSQVSQWSESDDTNQTASNPSSLGEVLKQTYAKVDKANKEISLLVSETGANKNDIAELKLTTGQINASVSGLKNTTDSLNNSISTLSTKVEAQMTPEAVKLQIESELANGTSKVTTATGFTFNEDGMRVSKSDSEMETTITEDGMTVYKNGETMLTANNVGVEAKNLNASTYLIIGKNSRFEDYGNDRTACFWIGG